MKQYTDLVKRILQDGEVRADRTAVGTLSVFDAHLTFDLRERFPLVTAKETRWKSAFLELLWFLRGEGNTNFLHKHGSTLWDAWADKNGNLGPVYGANWRRWGAKPLNTPQPTPRLREGVRASYLDVANGAGKSLSPLGKTWEGMIARCYDPNSPSYKTYGARGVHVCDRWLEFENFAIDAVGLVGYSSTPQTPRKVLDKDMLGDGFTYGPTECCWITDLENSASKAEWLYTVENRADGERYTFSNVVAFCGEHGVEAKNFSDLWTGTKNAKSRGGFHLIGKERLRRETDQVWNLINGLRADPHGRRHLVSAWNVADLPTMALPPCHWAHQCYVSNDGHLDLKVFLRSSDVALGLPFNIAQYALLTHLYARAAGLTARRLIVDLGDTHIYANHIDAMRAVADLGPVDDSATLVFNTTNHHIDGYVPGDFDIEGYTPRAFVPLPVAV